MGHFYYLLFLQGSGTTKDGEVERLWEPEVGEDQCEPALPNRTGLVLHSGALSSCACLDKTCPGAIQPTVQYEGGGPQEPLLCLRSLQQLKGSEGARVQAPHHELMENNIYQEIVEVALGRVNIFKIYYMHTWNPQWIQKYFKKLKSKVVWDDSQLSYNDRVQTAVAWSEAGSRRGIHGTQVTSKFTVSIVLMVSQVHRNSHVYKTVSF